MRVHLAAIAARTFRAKSTLAIALLTLGTACSDGSDTTAVENSDFLSLSSRSSKTKLTATLRDSSLQVGDTASMLLPAYRRQASDGNQAIIARYTSSDTTVVSVDSNGLVRALAVGTASVTARTVLGTGTVVATIAAQTVADPATAAEAPTSSALPPVNDAPAMIPITPEAPGVVPATPSTVPPSASTPVTVPPQTSGPTVVPPSVTLPTTPGTMPSFVAPQLPQASVDVSYPSPTRSIRVAANDPGALQAALDAAVGGDEVVLPDGATYVGAFHLPNRADAGTVVLRSATIPVAAHTRMTPSQAGSLATLRTTSVSPALAVDDGAHGWRVVGVRMQLADNAVDNYGIVTIGSGTQTSTAQFPRNIVLDRTVVVGSPTGNTSRCVSMNGVAVAVIDSWLSECHANGRDAQAIGGWTGTGPLLIDNNHLEGSGQAIMFGGSDPLVSGVTPADIVIRHNHLFKPLSWAGRWTVKAAFELKNAERVLFEGNVIENHWTDAQVGFAILMQAVNQDGRAPWSAVRDITVRLNVIRNSRSGVNLLSRLTTASAPVSQPSRRILLRDNSFESVGRDPINGAPGRFVQLLDDLEDVTLVQNTFFGTGASNAVVLDGKPLVRLALANNVFASATYGILGSGFGEGVATVSQFAPASTVSGNVLTGLIASLYGTGNVFPATLSASDFADASGGNYSLRAALAFSVLNGARTGVDGSAVLSATQGVTAR